MSIKLLHFYTYTAVDYVKTLSISFVADVSPEKTKIDAYDQTLTRMMQGLNVRCVMEETSYETETNEAGIPIDSARRGGDE